MTLLKKISNIKISLAITTLIIFTSCTHINYNQASMSLKGLASWYGPKFHGKLTSNKEKYNMYGLTAAHKTLPFGTMVKVTNSRNGKSIEVRINDRGPFIEGRIIDLSYAAAKAIDMVGPGVVPVRVEILTKLLPSELIPDYCVQVAAYEIKKKAANLKRKLNRTYSDVYIEKYVRPDKTFYRVRIKAKNIKSAQEIMNSLHSNGYEAITLEI